MKTTTGMFIRALVLGATLVSQVVPLRAQVSPDPARSQEAAVAQSLSALVADYERAWNTHDMAKWAQLFTPDSDFVNRRGGWWGSRDVNVEEHAAIHEMLAGRGTAMDLEAELAAVDLLSPGVALAHVVTAWPGAATSEDQERPPEAVMTWVVVETGGQWRIRAVQNTLVEPDAGPPPARENASTAALSTPPRGCGQ